MSKIKISKNPDKNWENNDIQFPRLLNELNATGFMTAEIEKQLLDEMDITREELDQLFERARQVWDEINSQLAHPLNKRSKSSA